jgi:hypothetical protein
VVQARVCKTLDTGSIPVAASTVATVWVWSALGVTSQLLVSISSGLGLLLSGIAISFRPRRALVGFVQIAPSLGLTLLTVPH